MSGYKGRESIALIILNVLVIGVLGIFYNSAMNEEGNVLGVDSCKQSSIEGRVFEDANQNGLRDTGEKGISKVSVNVSLANGNGFVIKDPGANDNDSSNDGYYSFCLNNNELVRVYFNNYSNEYHPGPRGKDSNTNIVFAAGNGKQKINFGLARNSDSYQIIDIGNRLWLDANGDGIQNVGERGIRGVKLDLLDQDQGGKKIASAVSDESGRYQFSCTIHPLNNPYGKYTVVIRDSNFLVDGALSGLKTTKKISTDAALDSNANEGLSKGVKLEVDLSRDKCKGCNFDFDIGFLEINPGIITPTQPKIVSREPEHFKCDSDYERLAVYSGEMNSNQQTNTAEFDLTLTSKYEIVLAGYVKEGLPEYGCPSGEAICQEKEKGESFTVNLNSVNAITYLDKGENVHDWSEVKSLARNFDAGEIKLNLNHTGSLDQINSVGYKLSICAKPIVRQIPVVISVTPSPTNTPTVSVAPSTAPTTQAQSRSILPITLSPTIAPTATGSVLSNSIQRENNITTTPTLTPTTGLLSNSNSENIIMPTPAVAGISTTLPNAGDSTDRFFIIGVLVVSLSLEFMFLAKKYSRLSLKRLKRGKS